MGGSARVKGWLEKIGGGGFAVIAALAIAAGAIGYRLVDTPAAPEQSAEQWQQQGFAAFEQGRFAEFRSRSLARWAGET